MIKEFIAVLIGLGLAYATFWMYIAFNNLSLLK